MVSSKIFELFTWKSLQSQKFFVKCVTIIRMDFDKSYLHLV